MNHSPDYRAVRFDGELYEFTASQAAVVRVLAEHPGLPLSTAYILEAAELGATGLPEIFRCKVGGKMQKHPSWNVLILPGTRRGTYYLAEPEKKKSRRRVSTGLAQGSVIRIRPERSS